MRSMRETAVSTMPGGKQGKTRTFAADAAHSRLLGLLAHDELVFSGVIGPHEYPLWLFSRFFVRCTKRRERGAKRAGRKREMATC